ncbi:MAG: LysR family transcriptional regulator [Christensenellales bacterium]|jgi:DNA-binding transcriptional LysR family regulator
MDIRELRYFVTLCEHMRFAPAAKALYITPQALSKSIRSMEEELHAELFKRERDGLRLTELGMVLLREAPGVLEKFDHMEQQLAAVASGQRIPLCVALCHGLLHTEFARYLSSCEDQHPKLEVELIELPDQFVEQYVDQEICDFGFAIGPPDNWEHFNFTLFQHYHTCAVVADSHPLAAKKSVILEDCAAYPIVTKNSIFKIYGIVENCARSKGIKLNYLLRSPNEVLWMKLVQEGSGVGIGTTMYDTSPGLVAIPFAEPQLAWDIYLIQRRSSLYSPAVQSLMKDVLRKFQR